MNEDLTLPSTDSLRASAAVGIAVITTLIGAPFAVANLQAGFPWVGFGALGMCLLLCLHALALRHQHPAAPVTIAAVAAGAVSLLAITVYERGAIGLFWAYPVIIGLHCMLPQRVAWWTNAALLVVVVATAHTVVPPATVVRVAATLFTVSAISAVLLNVIYSHHRLMVEHVKTDPLTGTLNRQTLRHVLEQARLVSQQTSTPMTLLAIDIDNFKTINDTGGHAKGDCALQTVGKLLRQWVRADDSVFRTGGDEFLILLRGVDAEGACQPADNLRDHLARTASTTCGVAVSMSGGLATLQDQQQIGDWLATADAALYSAKAQGRNRVIVAADTSERQSARAGGARPAHAATV